jgi:hypothetical protein
MSHPSSQQIVYRRKVSKEIILEKYCRFHGMTQTIHNILYELDDVAEQGLSQIKIPLGKYSHLDNNRNMYLNVLKSQNIKMDFSRTASGGIPDEKPFGEYIISFIENEVEFDQSINNK